MSRQPRQQDLRPRSIGIYTIHQPNDSEGTAPSHRNTQLSFPPPIESRAGSSGNPVLTRGIWIPACAGMTIYSRCVDTYALRGERSEGGEAGGDEGRGPRMRQRQNYVIYSWGTTLATYRWSAAYRDSSWLEKSPESYNPR